MNDLTFRLDIENYIILTSALINLFFAIFIFIKGRNKKSNISYSIFTLGVVFWSIGMFIYRGSVDYVTSLFWARFLYFASGSIPISLLFFSFVFPHEKLKFKKWKIGLIFIPAIFFMFSSFMGGFIVKDIVIERFSENKMIFGIGYNFWGAYLISYFVYSFIHLYKTYKTTYKVVKLQLKYILIGAITAMIAGAVTNLILPAFGNTNYGWMGQSFTIIMVGCTTYAIVKYRLMNIRLILSRSILYGVLVGAVAAFFALSVLVVGEMIGGNTRISKIFTYIINAFIVVIFLDPVKRVWARITDNIFYKDRIDYQLVLQEAGNVVAREIDLEKLLNNVSKLLADKLKIKRVLSFIPKDQYFSAVADSQQTKERSILNNDFVNYLKKYKKFVIVEELIKNRDELDNHTIEYEEVDNFINESTKLKAEMVIPVVEQDRLIAVIIFSLKNSGDLYSDEDINFLKVLVPQIAVAIEKSKLYEAVEKLNRELQAKVEARTKSLKEVNLALEERNKFLTTMQVVTNMISRNLDLKKANQMIANSIASELGYVGGILNFVDSEYKVLRLGALTENETTKEILQYLPQNPKNYESPLTENFNLGVQSVLSGRINFSDKMSDFLSPPVDKEIIDKIQGILKVKTVVGVPVFAEAKIIGVINYLLTVKRSEISSLDIEAMGALANQVGIVSRNLKLYDNLQKANRDLQEANLHLRDLDKAKSEFLSIASHQLRTPISAIKGYLSMILDGDFGKVSPKVKDVVNGIFESSARLARLVNIFLNVSRIESGRLKLEKRPLQINDLIESVVTELINQAKQKGLTLTYTKPKKKLPLILADSDKLREVILNLVDNSIKYTPKGSVTISVKYDQKELRFIVKDTGIGIDPKEAKGLFRKFVRGSGVAQIHTGGSGLGLFIAQKIIKEHDGHVWAESAGKGKGSVFQFLVPLYKG